MHDEGKMPLHVLVTQDWYHRDQRRENVSLLINKGIELQIGGQYSIGGLFICNTNQEVKDEIDGKWDVKLLPALEQVLAMPNNHHLPILQALIVNKAPPLIIKSAADAFTDSINTKDSFDKYPIDVAIDRELSWDHGMQKIVEAFVSEQQTTPLNICVKYGVQWENGTRNALENSGVDILETLDASTGLYPFMVAAAVGRDNEPNYGYDFDSIFHLIKSRPLVVRQFRE